MPISIVQLMLLDKKSNKLTFSTSITVTPTGIKTYPAPTAHGVLTITNGSILQEELPQGMIVTAKDRVEIITDTAVFVPAGSATGLGYATVM